MRIPPNITLPDNWEDMTEEEKMEYVDENRPEGAPMRGHMDGGEERFQLPQ